MNFLTRGLYALILTIFFQTQLVAEYLYKDEIIFNPNFTQEVNTLGKELYETTGIALRLIMLKKLPEGINILDYESKILEELKDPTVLLIFSELDSQVDIAVNDSSLYKYFDRNQVLSPVASPVQAFTMALFYNNGYESFKEIASSHSGTIIPLLAAKAKKGEKLGKYSGSMFNGYADIAEQIADSKGVVLENAVGNANRVAITVVKFIFYGVILMALIMYIKRQLFYRKEENESK